MHIYLKVTEQVRPETSRSSQSTDAMDRDAICWSTRTGSLSELTEEVSISDSVLALAAHEGCVDTASPPDSDRADRIRERVLSGAYATLEVIDALARRLLVSGDL